MTTALIFGVLFLMLSIGVFSDAPFVMAMDARVDGWFHSLRTPRWAAFFSAISFFGGVYGIGLIAAVTVLLTAWNEEVIELGVTAVGGSALVAQLVKVFTARTRPDPLAGRTQEVEYSYPSGHTTAALTLYGMLALLLVPFATSVSAVFIAVYVLLIIAISVSRIALSVHHASDVVGGYLLGAAFLSLAFGLF